MALIPQCDRCESQNSILTSRKFAGNIVVAVTPSPHSPMHLCPNCLAELLLDAVVALDTTPCARDYAETVERAAQASKAFAAVERVGAECDALKEKLQEARSQATVAGQYQGWSTERASLVEKIEALEAARNVALTRAAQAEKNSADVLKRAQAAATQARADEKGDPEYVASVAAREAKRASGRP